MMKINFQPLKSSFLVTAGFSLLLIFMVAMKYPAEKQRSYTYLALGDSYTIGEKVPAAENFPHQVLHILRTEGIPIKEPRIVAKTGWTTDELEEAISRENIRDTYDFVTLLIGVNNQYRGRQASEYTAGFESLLQKAIAFAGNNANRVIVLSIPDWGITPFAEGRNRKQIALEIDGYNRINRELSNRYHVHYLDITPETRKAERDPGLLTEDGLHPSGKEYAKWATRLPEVENPSFTY
jgi:lysophospholipase L1-like esterase